MFELFDRDHSGYIDISDLAVISSKLGREPEEVINIIRPYDANGDNRVSFTEFVNAMASIESGKPKTYWESGAKDLEDSPHKALLGRR